MDEWIHGSTDTHSYIEYGFNAIIFLSGFLPTHLFGSSSSSVTENRGTLNEGRVARKTATSQGFTQISVVVNVVGWDGAQKQMIHRMRIGTATRTEVVRCPTNEV